MIEGISFVGRLRENCVRAKRVIRIGSLTFPFCHENSSFHEWSNEIDSGLKKLSLIFRNKTFQWDLVVRCDMHESCCENYNKFYNSCKYFLIWDIVSYWFESLGGSKYLYMWYTKQLTRLISIAEYYNGIFMLRFEIDSNIDIFLSNSISFQRIR